VLKSAAEKDMEFTRAFLENFNIKEKLAGKSDVERQAIILYESYKYAESINKKFVPFIYLDGAKYEELYDLLVELGIEWIMKGSADQHISYQQVLEMPEKYFVCFISFVPEKLIKPFPGVGFAKGITDNVSRSIVLDGFCKASFDAFDEVGGEAVFMRTIDNEANRDSLKGDFIKEVNKVNKENGIITEYMKRENVILDLRNQINNIFNKNIDSFSNSRKEKTLFGSNA